MKWWIMLIIAVGIFGGSFYGLTLVESNWNDGLLAAVIVPFTLSSLVLYSLMTYKATESQFK